MKRTRGDAEAARRKALADAVAGVVGSLVSMLAFYPVDVWKTRLQAGVETPRKGNDGDDFDSDKSPPSSTPTSLTKTAQEDSSNRSLLPSSFLPSLSKLFLGLPHKAAHTVISSFTYFFVYSLVQTRFASYRRSLASSRGGGGGSSGDASTSGTSTATKLALAAFAAAINVFITLPLDTISSRKQAGGNTNSNGSAAHKSNGADSGGPTIANDTSSQKNCASTTGKGIYNADERNGLGEKTDSESSHEKQTLYIKSASKYKFSFSTNLAEEAFAVTNATDSTDAAPVRGDGNNPLDGKSRRRLHSFLSLWNGLSPAILLCSNPAIQYTMYDTLKIALLRRRWTGNGLSTAPADSGAAAATRGNSKLSMWEAFALGLVSKFFATIATYPLIRCKVMLMVSPAEADGERDFNAGKEARREDEYGGNGSSNGQSDKRERTSPDPPRPTNGTREYPKSLPLLLMHIFCNDGIRGLYKGCSLQLLHTILKSALLMMVRERITLVSHNFFQIEDDGG